jgi:hypothetical protein
MLLGSSKLGLKCNPHYDCTKKRATNYTQKKMRGNENISLQNSTMNIVNQ